MVERIEDIALYLNIATNNMVSAPTAQNPFYGVVAEYELPDDFDSTSYLTLVLEKPSDTMPVIIHDGGKTFDETGLIYKGSKVNEQRNKKGNAKQVLYLPITKENSTKQIKKLAEVIINQMGKSLEHEMD